MVLIDAAATGLGLLAAGLLVSCPLIASVRRLLLVQAGVGAALAGHFLLLDLAPAAAMNGLAAVQSLAALAALRRPALGVVGYAIIPLMWVAAALSWSGPLTLLAVVAMTVVAVARTITREIPMRLAFLAGSTLWFLHDALASAWIAMAADILCAGIGLAFILHRLGLHPTMPGRRPLGPSAA